MAVGLEVLVDVDVAMGFLVEAGEGNLDAWAGMGDEVIAGVGVGLGPCMGEGVAFDVGLGVMVEVMEGVVDEAGVKVRIKVEVAVGPGVNVGFNVVVAVGSGEGVDVKVGVIVGELDGMGVCVAGVTGGCPMIVKVPRAFGSVPIKIWASYCPDSHSCAERSHSTNPSPVSAYRQTSV